MRTAAPALLLTGLLGLSSVGCIQHEGQLAVFLTSGSAAGTQSSVTAQQVNVEVISVAVQDTSSGEFLTLSQGSQIHEVVGLAGRGSLLALANELSEGSYSRIRITFSTAKSSVVNAAGRANPLNIEPTTVTVPAFFQVVEDGSVDVRLELDLAASLSQRNSGAWVLRPVLRHVDEVR